MAAALVAFEQAIVVRRCLEHHVQLAGLLCPLGGRVYMRLAGRQWRHLKRTPRVERYPQAWEVYSNLSHRVLAVVVGTFTVEWADDERDWTLVLSGREDSGQAQGPRRAGRRGWKPAYQIPARYHLVAPPKNASTPEEEAQVSPSIDPAEPLGYPPTR